MPTVNIHLVSVTGAYSLASKSKEIFNATRRKLRSAGVRLRLKKQTIEPSGEKENFGSLTRYYWWLEKAKANKWFRGVDIVHVLDTPLRIGDEILVGGISSVCGDFGMSFVTEQNKRNEPRLAASYCAMAHEVGHTLGANHDESTMNLMHPAPLPYATILDNQCDLPINSLAVQEIRACTHERN
jgi:hypothetical protein